MESPNRRVEIIKILQGKIYRHFHEFGFGNGCLDISLKKEETHKQLKNRHIGIYQNQNIIIFCCRQRTIRRTQKDKHRMGENIFTSY